MRPASGSGGSGSEARNRWLSEDEGSNEPIAGPSSRPAGSDSERSSKRSTPLGDRDREPKPVRPRPSRRAISSEALSTRPITPLASAPPPPPTPIGYNPPEISHLVSAPAQVANAAIAGGSLIPPPSVTIPDFEAGRGGDGIGGVARPSTALRREPIVTINTAGETPEERSMREDEILAKLRRILGW
jgi:hypothetical protein